MKIFRLLSISYELWLCPEHGTLWVFRITADSLIEPGWNGKPQRIQTTLFINRERREHRKIISKIFPALEYLPEKCSRIFPVMI
jgi:hypothetical protein